MKIDIQVSNKQLFGLIVVLVAVSAVGYVKSYGTNDPTIFGHSSGEIEIDGAGLVGALTSYHDSGRTEYTQIGHGGSNGYVNTVGDGRLDFRHDGNTLMTILDNGRVGIGTTNPSNFIGWPASLQVNGEIRAARYYDDDENYYLDINTDSFMNNLDINGQLVTNGNVIVGGQLVTGDVIVDGQLVTGDVIVGGFIRANYPSQPDHVATMAYVQDYVDQVLGQSTQYTQCRIECGGNNDEQCGVGYTRAELLVAGNGCQELSLHVVPNTGERYTVRCDNSGPVCTQSACDETCYLFLDGGSPQVHHGSVQCEYYSDFPSSCAVCCN